MKQARGPANPAAQGRVGVFRSYNLAEKDKGNTACSAYGPRKGLGTWAHRGSWKQSQKSRRDPGRKEVGVYRALLHGEPGSPREPGPGTELLSSLDGLALS